MNGAEALAHTLVDAGVDVLFANPGTSEMHFVAALDRVAGMRCVLTLFEGVATGAADGYFRIARRPAGTLLHLGPGLANGLANLHNARKAHSGIVNVVGDHATAHLALDAPLTSDLAAVARSMSHWVGTVPAAAEMARMGRAAVAAAQSRPGQVATLILPADKAWSEFDGEAPALGPVGPAALEAVAPDTVEQAAALLREHGASTLLLLGGPAVRGDALQWAGRIAAATGCAVMSELYAECIERGAGRVALPRLPYAVDAAMSILRRFRRIVLVGAAAPVAFFAYPDKPGRLTAPDTEILALARRGNNMEDALRRLCEALDAVYVPYLACELPSPSVLPAETDALNSDTIGALLSTLIPEHAIVVDEAVTTGRGFDAATRNAAPHDWLTIMGGSIGYGLPAAVGAAMAAPDRKVIALEGDGSAMYTLQALWTMAREQLDVTVIVFANRRYQILEGEFSRIGAGVPGKRAAGMLTIGGPDLQWVALAAGHGVPACRAANVAELRKAIRHALASGGPSLIEVLC
ncbi:acetolactate synthase large subunit [Cupriavidus sp. WS]|uniref:acetolactate synthase large subunit n=1 Tax=Cupriavidus sp. WS TaxID=1312922 RepID=UPI00039EB392|nr:acetolactate synthase large subunit [Cupriavidus sp. WS]